MGDRTGNNSGGLASRVLTSITPYGRGGYTGTLSAHLPATEMVYTALDNRTTCYAHPTFPYGRLAAMRNGYGAQATLAHEAPEASWGCWDPSGVPLPYVNNWRVAQRTVTDTLTPALIAQYDYLYPCYLDGDNPSKCWGQPVPGGGLAVNHITGYGVVTQTTYGGGVAPGQLLSRSEHEFIPGPQDWTVQWWGDDLGARTFALAGREVRVRQLDGQGHVLAETAHGYTNTVTVEHTGTDPDSGQPVHDALFSFESETIQSQYDPAGGLLARTRSATTYESIHGKPVVQYAYGATQVITNGGFEGGRSHVAGAVWAPAGWQAFYNQAPLGDVGVAPLAHDAATVIGGAGLVITHTVAGDCQCGVYQDVAVPQAGTGYRVSVRARRAQATDTASFRLWLQGDGGNPSTYYPGGTASGWQVLSQVITPTTTNVRIILSLESGAGTFYADDAWYERLDETGDERTQKTWYGSAPVTGTHWVVGLPVIQAVYTGTLAPVDPDGTEASMTAFGYDGHEPIAGEIITGALTAQRTYITPTADFLSDYGKMVTTTMGYDADSGTLLWTQDGLGRRATTGYDPIYGVYPVTFTNALTQTGFLTYDLVLGKVVTATDAQDVQTWLVYDGFGRLTKVVEDANSPYAAQRDTLARPTRQYVYSDTYRHNGLIGLRVATIQREVTGSDAAADVQTLFEFYTGRGVLVQSRAEMGSQGSPQQAVTTPGYDAAGRVITGYVPYQATAYSADYEPSQRGTSYTRTQFDSLGRTVTVTGTAGLTTTTAYNGLQTAVRDANGHLKVSIVDTHGQLVQVKEYAGVYSRPYFTATAYATTRYAYNVLGNLIRVTDQGTNETRMNYNAVGQKLGMDDPDMQSWTYTYDAAGNLLTQTDAQGAQVCFAYDRLNRLVAKRYDGNGACPASATDAYGYDQGTHGVGQRTAMTNTNALVTWTYDRRGRVTAETRTITGMGVYTYRFGYSSANQVITTTYPTGETITSTYTAAGQPHTLASTWRSYVTGAEYNVRGGLDWFKQYTTGTNTFVQTSYDYYDSGSAPSFRLRQLDVSYENGEDTLTNHLRLDYRYDPVGNVRALTDTKNYGQVQAFGYDALDRLVSAAGDGGSGSAVGVYSDTYTYGELGSPTTMDGRTYAYAGSGHAHAVRYAYVLGTGGRFDTFTITPTNWTFAQAQNLEVPYSDEGEPVLRHGGNTSASTVYRDDLALGDGDALHIEFKADTSTSADLALQVESSGAYQAYGLVATQGHNVRLRSKMTNEQVEPMVTTWAYDDCGWTLAADVWYVLRLEVGDGGDHKFRAALWRRDDPSIRCYTDATSGYWANKSWRFRSWANTQSGNPSTRVTLDSYFELQAGGSVWDYAYDPNGNMIARVEAGTAYAQTWDALNRLVQVTYGVLTSTVANATYTFSYDAESKTRFNGPGNNGRLAVSRSLAWHDGHGK